MESHKAVVMGRIERKIYKFHDRNSWYVGSVREDKELIEHKQIWDGDLENPPLEISDWLYVKSKGLKVKVLDKAKSTDGGFVYWTDHVIEIIEDNKTIDTKKEAESKKVKYDKWLEAKQKSDSEVIEKILIPKKWYQFWK
jgi:hypothetical protein